MGDMLTSAAHALPVEDSNETAGPAPCTVQPSMLTTEGRMQRAGLNELERIEHRRAIGRATRDVSPDAGMAVRRSLEVHAELRRVLGADFAPRT